MVREKEHKVKMEPTTKRGKGASGSSTPGRLTKFWTACPKCKVQSEYPRKCLRCTIFCGKCGEMFVGTEVPAPSASQGESSVVLPQAEFHRNLWIRQARNKKSANAPKDSVPAAGNLAGLSDGEQVAFAVQPSKDKRKRGPEAIEAILRKDNVRGKFSSSSETVTDLSNGGHKSSNLVLRDIDLNELPSEAADEPSTYNSDISFTQKKTLESILRIMRMVAKKR